MAVNIEPSGDRISVNGEDVALIKDIESGGDDIIGYWTKFPDGTLMQWHRHYSVAGDTTTGEVTVVFPIPFVIAPSVVSRSDAKVNGQLMYYILDQGSPTLTSFLAVRGKYNSGSPGPSADAFGIAYQAIGRWK